MPSSLSGRLMLVSSVFTLVALAFALVVMWHVLDRFVTGQIDQRLDNKIVQLASQVRAGADGTLNLDGDADGPPFDKPHHRAFWWIGGPRNNLHSRWLRSGDFQPPSAGDIAALPAPPPPPGPVPPDADAPDPAARDHPRTLDGIGPDGVALHLRVARRTIGSTTVTILAAAPQDSITKPMREAMTSVGAAMGALGLALLLATLAQIRLGLRPLARLRHQIAAVRDGRRTALPVDQPREILPLVDELNSLLAQNAENLSRARRHVANLAHGLKTPLATMALQVARMPGPEAQPLRDLVGLVERRIRHHLGRARAAALDGPVRAQTQVGPRLADLAEALQKIYADRQVAFSLDCEPGLVVACEPQDVDEMLGNLLENAFKYTASRVGCRARAVAATVEIAIEDDGPGLSPDEIARVMRPGQRLDEDGTGFGFGLPIARELAELYGGDLALSAAGPGLHVRLTLPRPVSSHSSR